MALVFSFHSELALRCDIIRDYIERPLEYYGEPGVEVHHRIHKGKLFVLHTQTQHIYITIGNICIKHSVSDYC